MNAPHPYSRHNDDHDRDDSVDDRSWTESILCDADGDFSDSFANISVLVTDCTAAGAENDSDCGIAVGTRKSSFVFILRFVLAPPPAAAVSRSQCITATSPDQSRGRTADVRPR